MDFHDLWNEEVEQQLGKAFRRYILGHCVGLRRQRTINMNMPSSDQYWFSKMV